MATFGGAKRPALILRLGREERATTGKQRGRKYSSTIGPQSIEYRGVVLRPSTIMNRTNDAPLPIIFNTNPNHFDELLFMRK